MNLIKKKTRLRENWELGTDQSVLSHHAIPLLNLKMCETRDSIGLFPRDFGVPMQKNFPKINPREDAVVILHCGRANGKGTKYGTFSGMNCLLMSKPSVAHEDCNTKVTEDDLKSKQCNRSGSIIDS